ncbi:MAG: hypothetical protein ACYDEV_10910 [Acidiferrobacter sp.]
MVSVMPVTATALVQRLAHASARRPSVLGRLLGLMPTLPKPTAQTAPTRPVDHRPAVAFVVYAHKTTPTVSPSAARSFGIRPGSWIAVQLRHGITDSDSALVVLHMAFPVRGQDGVLPAGTRLLAHVEMASRHRVQLSVFEAVTPHDRRIPFDAVVFDSQFHLGLPGFVEGGRRAAVLVALGRSFLESADAALSMIGAQSSLASQVASNTGRNTLGAAFHWRFPRHIVYVPAQRAYVQTQKGS